MTIQAAQDALFLARCNQLARLGGRHVFPNPCVGSVIVHDGHIIGEGWHQQVGGPHAEVNAVHSVKERTLLSQATLYVNLEPCSTHGRTPPCADLILESGIPRVVIGCMDPNPQVAGRGIKKLREAGVEVVLAEDPQPFIDLNKRFFVNQLLKRPYISLKWAQSANGQIASHHTDGQLKAVTITGYEARCLTHRLRAEHQAILVGRNTAAIDDPLLNNRHYYGGQPLRLVLDRHGKLSESLRLFHSPPDPVWLLTENSRQALPPHVEVKIFSPWPDSLTLLFQKLYQELGVCSILVEGGQEIHEQCLAEELFDELFVYQGNTAIMQGYPAARVPTGLSWPQPQSLGADHLWHFSLTRFHPLMPDRVSC